MQASWGPWADAANVSGGFLDEVLLVPESPHGLRVAAALIYSLVCALGLTGNLLVLRLAAGTGWRGRAAGDRLVFQLALAGIQLALALPFWAAELALDYTWPFGHAMCKLVLSVTVLSVYASAFFLTTLSVGRYRAAAGRDLRPRRGAICWVTSAIWLGAGIASLPAAIYAQTISVNGEELCVQRYPESWHWSEVYKLQRIALTFLAPLVAIGTSYAQLLRLLRGRESGVARPGPARLMPTIAAAFFLCWLPNHAIALWEVLVRLEAVPWGPAYHAAHTYVHPLAICLANANSCFNPILYCLARREFRRTLRADLAWLAQRRHPLGCLRSSSPRLGGHGAPDLPLHQMDSQAICSSGHCTPSSNTSVAAQEI
ncbi:relaxin-3 receptor 2-like [Chiloscyllium plagiosum]|uniref:relaxin-3 receptor 2-like n=1 Tax=Chiloscyllium plagiosum TaxID=36176 RepID=UPI001CB80BC0|nr:relaxin-3 receptor 2-like [Chiloscyllium plagiosum]